MVKTLVFNGNHYARYTQEHRSFKKSVVDNLAEAFKTQGYHIHVTHFYYDNNNNRKTDGYALWVAK